MGWYCNVSYRELHVSDNYIAWWVGLVCFLITIPNEWHFRWKTWDMQSEINWSNASIRKQAVSMLSGNGTSSHLEGVQTIKGDPKQNFTTPPSPPSVEAAPCYLQCHQRNLFCLPCNPHRRLYPLPLKTHVHHFHVHCLEGLKVKVQRTFFKFLFKPVRTVNAKYWIKTYITINLQECVCFYSFTGCELWSNWVASHQWIFLHIWLCLDRQASTDDLL